MLVDPMEARVKDARWIAALLCLASADAIAGGCTPDTQVRWGRSDKLALVRIIATGVAAADWPRGALHAHRGGQ